MATKMWTGLPLPKGYKAGDNPKMALSEVQDAAYTIGQVIFALRGELSPAEIQKVHAGLGTSYTRLYKAGLVLGNADRRIRQPIDLMARICKTYANPRMEITGTAYQQMKAGLVALEKVIPQLRSIAR